jgi:urea transporter
MSNWKDKTSFAIDAVLNSYAIIFFSRSRGLGLVLLAATFLAPQFGAIGLIGLCISLAAALVLGFDREQIRSGALLFNSLLVSFALVFLYNYQHLSLPVLAMVLTCSVVVTVFVTVFTAHSLHTLFRLPSMSLPFVTVTLLLFFLFYSFTRTPITASTPYVLLPEIPCPWMAMRCFLQAFGAIFFLPHATVGLVIFIALLCHSRLAGLYAVVGFAAGMLVMHGLHMDITPAGMAYVGFNFVFCAIALGGIFFVPSKSSLLLVVLGAFFCATIAIAVRSFLLYFGVPPLALPFNLVVLLMVYTMRLRTSVRHCFCTPFTPDRPEVNVRNFKTDLRRFPDALHTSLFLPFFGERTVTQGFNGAITHRGQWRYGLDFEVLDTQGSRYNRDDGSLADYHTFDSPVAAPAPATVVRVLDSIPDNAIGSVNLENNWGNTIVLLLDNGLYVKLCHLKQGSATVAEGERVAHGHILARCGNSGRSPVPHLHLQLQASPQVGSHTLPFRLYHYVELREGQKHYHTCGVPREGSRIRDLPINADVASGFDSFVTHPPRFRVTTDGSSYEETITTTISDAGLHELHTESRKATLTVRLTERSFFAVGFRGDRKSILLLLYLGLGRMPFTSEHGVCWTDELDPHALLNPWGRLWQDLLGPFTGMPTLHTRSTTAPASDAITEVHTEVSPACHGAALQSSIPHRIVIHLSKRSGIARIHSESKSGAIQAEIVHDNTN